MKTRNATAVRLMSGPLLLLALGSLFLARNDVAAGHSGSTPRCSPSGSVTVAESSEARVYRKKKSSTIHFACWKRTGRTRRLDDPSREISYYGRPAMSLAGSVLVSGKIEERAFDTYSPRFVVVEDLRSSLAGGSAVPSDGFLAEVLGVGAIRAKSNGSFACIECPSSDVINSCSAEGPFEVYRVPVSRRPKPQRLDRSSGIEPNSLTLSGPRLSWTRFGKRYSASLR